MFKTTIAAAGSVHSLCRRPCRTYVNVEANAGWVGDDYTSTTTNPR